MFGLISVLFGPNPVVDGDYRIDNVAIRGDGSVAAVLDWELCTIGDPLADLGVLLLNWVGPEEPTEHMLSGTPTRLGGFPDRDFLLQRYAERSGADLSQIAFYVGFGYWRLACIAEGIYVRLATGAMGDASETKRDGKSTRAPSAPSTSATTPSTPSAATIVQTIRRRRRSSGLAEPIQEISTPWATSPTSTASAATKSGQYIEEMLRRM